MAAKKIEEDVKYEVINVFTVGDDVTLVILDTLLCFYDKNLQSIKGRHVLNAVHTNIDWLIACCQGMKLNKRDDFIFAAEVASIPEDEQEREEQKSNYNLEDENEEQEIIEKLPSKNSVLENE